MARWPSRPVALRAPVEDLPAREERIRANRGECRADGTPRRERDFAKPRKAEYQPAPRIVQIEQTFPDDTGWPARYERQPAPYYLLTARMYDPSAARPSALQAA
jgi:hypothetical protein